MVVKGFRDLTKEEEIAGEIQDWPNEEPEACEVGNHFDKPTGGTCRVEGRFAATNITTAQEGSLCIEDANMKKNGAILIDTDCDQSEVGQTGTREDNLEKGPDRLAEETSCGSVSSNLEEEGICRRVPARHVLAVMAFLGCANLFTLRVNLSVALVAMVNHTSSDNRSHSNDECDVTANTSLHEPEEEFQNGEFDWDARLQAQVLGSFYYGYCMTQIFGGWLAGVIGGKRVLGVSIFITSILTLLTPTAATLHAFALVVVRVLQGIAQGVAFPSIHSIWSTWAPVRERSRLVAFSYAGAQLGTVIAMPVSGILCELSFLGGWPAAFYVFGGLGVLWCAVWTLLVHDSPSLHPRISYRERNYILGTTTYSAGGRQKASLKPPWRKIFSTPAVWAIIGAHFAYDWGCFTTLTMLPQYMYQILRFDIKQNGALSALPYLVLWCTNSISGPVADCLRNHRFSVKVTRKIMNSLGLLIPAGLILWVGYVGCDPTLAVVLLTLGVGMSGFTLSGYCVNHIDIAPRFAGILMGISNSVGTTAGFIGPVVVGALTNHNPSLSQWRVFFLITAAIYAVGGVVFLIFSEGKETDWSKSTGSVSKTNTRQQTLFIPKCEVSDSKSESPR